MRKQGIVYIILLIGLWSCRQDVENVSSSPISFAPELLQDYEKNEDIVLSSVTGFVKDENGEPLSEALVTLNNLATETDAFGHFFFNAILMNAEGTSVIVRKSNFHQISKSFHPQENVMEHLEIIMTTIKSNDDLPTGLGTQIQSLHENIIVEFSDNSFLNNDSSPYTGIVHVESTLLSNNAAEFYQKSLGNLQAVDLQNELVSLAPDALLYISYKDDAGNLLAINEDAETKLSIPVDYLSTGAMAWYYAPDYGLYTPNTELQFSADGNDILLNVKHNLPIIFAQSYASTRMTLKLFASNGEDVLENSPLSVISEDGKTLYVTRSNSEGVATIVLPNEKSATLQVKNACNEVVYNEAASSINPMLNLAQIELATVTGDLYDCEVMPNSNAVLSITQGGQQQYYYPANENFSLRLQTCNNGLANMQGLESTSGDASTTSAFDLKQDSALGDIFTCTSPSINELRIENMDSGEMLVYPIEELDGNTVNLTAFGNTSLDIGISFNGSSTGDYSAADLHSILRIWDDENGFRYAGDATTFSVERFGDDTIILGKFEGEFENTLTGEMDKIKGHFNFYRD